LRTPAPSRSTQLQTESTRPPVSSLPRPSSRKAAKLHPPPARSLRQARNILVIRTSRECFLLEHRPGRVDDLRRSVAAAVAAALRRTKGDLGAGGAGHVRLADRVVRVRGR